MSLSADKFTAQVHAAIARFRATSSLQPVSALVSALDSKNYFFGLLNDSSAIIDQSVEIFPSAGVEAGIIIFEAMGFKAIGAGRLK